MVFGIIACNADVFRDCINIKDDDELTNRRVMDSQLPKYKGMNGDLEYCRIANEYYECYGPDDIAEAMVNELVSNGVTTLRMDYDLHPRGLKAILEQIFLDKRMTTDVMNQLDSLGRYYDLGVISITDQE